MRQGSFESRLRSREKESGHRTRLHIEVKIDRIEREERSEHCRCRLVAGTAAGERLRRDEMVPMRR